jgi:hypothetical protein
MARLRKPPRRRQRSPQFDAPDQYRVRTELATFFGPNAHVYIDMYDKMRAGDGSWACRSWSWPIFFGSFSWFFYRKMYGAGAVMLFVPMILSYLLGSTGAGASIFFAMVAKGLYDDAALARITKADQMGLQGADRHDYLQCAGGVSLAAGVLAGLAYFSMLALVAAAVVVRRHHLGH